MLIRRTCVAGVLSLAGLLVNAAVASADDGWGNADCTQNPLPGCELTAGTGGGHGGSGNGGGGGAQAGASTPAPNCGGPLDPLCSAAGVIQNPAPSPAELALLARSQLRLPRPIIEVNPAGDQLVNLPTWLWLRDGWRDISATAEVPGVSVTAVGRPRLVTWSMGDGAVVSCLGPGMAFPSGANPRSSSPVCGHTYRTSSAGQPSQVYRLTVTVHWSVTWSGAGQGGTFPELTTTSTMTLRVAEAQAVNSSG